MAGIGVGAHVKVGAKKGVVRFIGTTSFAVGEWYGVELAQPVTPDEKITLAMFDRRRPRPRPVMTEQQGFNVSSSLFTRYAGFHAPTYPTSLRRST